MRLYLSSYRMGDHPDRMLALLPEQPGEVAVIANALDAQAKNERAAGVRRETDALAQLGLRATEVDLRAFFDRPVDAVAAALARFPLIWVRGGNVFMLRYALARSGADSALTTMLRRDTVVYAGYSAGGCVLAPSLRGLEECDDPQVVPETYGDPPIWDGLGVLDYALVPHVDSPGHPETEVLTKLAVRYRAAGVAHRALRDGQALVIDGPDSHALGRSDRPSA
jgi:dipeptidase E